MDYEIDYRIIIVVLVVISSISLGNFLAEWLVEPTHEERCIRAGYAEPEARRLACADSLRAGGKPPFHIPEDGTVGQ